MINLNVCLEEEEEEATKKMHIYHQLVCLRL